MKRTTAALLTLICFAVSCARKQQTETTGVVAVKGTAAQQQAVDDAMRMSPDSKLLSTMPASRVQAWQIPSEGIAAIEARLRQQGVAYVESLPGATTSIVADASVDVGQLSGAEQRIVRAFTEGLPPDAYRVSEDRPERMALDLFRESFRSNERVALRLPNTQTIEFVRTSFEPGPRDSLTWTGRSPDGPGDAVLVISEAGITGTLRLREATYSLLPLPGGRQLIFRRDQGPPQEHPQEFRSGARRGRVAKQDEAPIPPCSAPQSSVDVLAVYTKDAAALLPSVHNSIQLAFKEMTDSFTASRISARARLVGIEPIAYSEVPEDFDKNLQALVRMGTTASDPLFKMRDARTADVVLMVSVGRKAAGLAESILAMPDTAFAVVSLPWMTGPNYSFGHEIGHLFGARHDPASDGENSPFPYGHGFIDTRGEWRTIMAYDLCACPRVPRWANPSVSYDHNNSGPRVTGTASESDDARVLRTTFSRLAQFRCSTT